MFTVYQFYSGCESFRVMATTPEEAIEVLEREGSETEHVSARLHDEYLGIDHHAVHDIDDDTLLLTTAPDAESSTALTVSFRIERRDDGLYFTAQHKSGAKQHGPYDEQELNDTLAHYLRQDVTETLLAEEFVPGSEDLIDQTEVFHTPDPRSLDQ